MAINSRIICELFVVLMLVLVAADRHEEGNFDHDHPQEWFLLQHSKHVVKTDAGDMRLVKSSDSMMHIGFIAMEPRSLFIPQYLDSSLILFVHGGEARVGHIHKDDLVEKDMKTGDVYRIAAGSTFYLINTADEGQRLHVICSIDASQSLGWHTFQSFVVAGGTYPRSVLSGFDHSTLSIAFNVTEAEVGEMLTRQKNGPIVYLNDSSDSPTPTSIWSKFMNMELPKKLVYMRRIVRMNSIEDVHEEQQPTLRWSNFSKFLISLFGKAAADKRMDDQVKRSSYNIYDRKPDFKNNYGWSVALDESDYSPLRDDDIGVYLVNLSAGSMMAPHINPRATEYGIVLRGAGTIQIVYPNGSLAMNAKVSEGDVFWIPRYFPFCQIASHSGSFEFFGFTTSARNNKPQFLVGANSLMHKLRGVEFAAAFGMSEERLKEIIERQRESVILPSVPIAPRRQGKAKRSTRGIPKMIKSLSNEMIMGFD